MNFAYVKESNIEQTEVKQFDGLKKYNINKWFTEEVSFKDTNRPRLDEMIEFAMLGDTIYIHSLDRLAHSTEDLIDIVDRLKEKGVNLVSNNEAIDSSTSTGKLMLTMVGAICFC